MWTTLSSRSGMRQTALPILMALHGNKKKCPTFKPTCSNPLVFCSIWSCDLAGCSPETSTSTDLSTPFWFCRSKFLSQRDPSTKDQVQRLMNKESSPEISPALHRAAACDVRCPKRLFSHWISGSSDILKS